MGLLDQITGALGGQGDGKGNLMQVVMQLVQNHPGGLQGLIDQFSQAGLAQHVQSWIGTGSNLPVSGADIAKAFSGGQLAQIASQLGLDQGQAADSLAQDLPGMVDKLTPNGRIETGGMLEQGFAALKNLKL